MLMASAAWSQTVTITASHDDPDGIVAPGQTVHITHTLSMTAYMVSDWRGDAAVTPNLGAASNISSYFVPSPWASFTGPSGGSVVGFAASHPVPLFVPVVIPPWNAPQSILMEYDWTAPSEPGVYEFRWTPHPSSPLVSGYLSSTTGVLTPYPTTYLGATLTVIPAPAAAPLLLAAALVPNRRQSKTSR
ncbi:MAG: hypothetical protein KDA05_06945 [Phycisphaerales bacterium]|nr:hypothetical protein [Phycisphaerales bacterium]